MLVSLSPLLCTYGAHKGPLSRRGTIKLVTSSLKGKIFTRLSTAISLGIGRIFPPCTFDTNSSSAPTTLFAFNHLNYCRQQCTHTHSARHISRTQIVIIGGRQACSDKLSLAWNLSLGPFHPMPNVIPKNSDDARTKRICANCSNCVAYYFFTNVISLICFRWVSQLCFDSASITLLKMVSNLFRCI